MTKRISIALAIVAFAAFLVPTTAFANIAIHGNYVNDTDACAGCHRAHTSASSMSWVNTEGASRSALLVSSATLMTEFCYACHDSQGEGADTNVTDGLYYGTLYGENMGVLNGGGFESFDNIPVTSIHIVDGAPWGAYGGGYAGQGKTGATGLASTGPNENELGKSSPIAMDCSTCHDPHGSSNYRVLKSQVNGNYVGGYTPSGDPENPDPDGYVSSVETGWPTGGFLLHTEYPAYQPNYTTPMYAKGYDADGTTENVNKGMSGWCAGCHNTYLGDPDETFTNRFGAEYQSLASTYDAGDQILDALVPDQEVGLVGYKLRHKHPVNVEFTSYKGPDESSMIVTDLVLPVANDHGEKGSPSNTDTDWIECLTCHRAHGTIAQMTGLAAEAATVTPEFLSEDAVPSALLRLDNRGVCERCHNK